ncbi:1-acyl-sn-glycerol-3-phosphate acyltransferase [Leifsonia sp. ZF2019]|uniref:lysophospholipid acyltransferase family protein n=1 Tax=Leifsonia sp. ZF2019 TaxID=2781978 RepID=UPI001CBEB861|nr:lysophospholipid acyltransferase family protein [Leifsonia sp. ZF2019]UAJ81100.1 1-acyl-sn-glycerol-3-phosphate acyltransferase [Leifsonia sp. ZF2019]
MSHPEDPAVPRPPVKRQRSEKSRPSIFWVLAFLVVPLGSLLARFRIADGAKLPRHGAFIVAPNHYSEIDPVMMGMVLWRLGRLPRFLAKDSLFRVPVVGWFLRKSGQVPVARGGAARGAAPLDAAQKIIDEGRIVVVYPEGSLTRDPDMWPMRGKTGAARMALEHGIPVIPMAHWGTQQVMARYSKKISFFPRKTIDVKVGDPVDLSAFEGRSLDSATLAEATAVIMAAITALLEDLRGEKAPAQRWDPSQHNQKETGRFDG